MNWISGRDLYWGMPHWIVEIFFKIFMQDMKELEDALRLKGGIQDFDFEIFKDNNSSMYGVRLYHDNILLREYNEGTNYMICYFEPISEYSLIAVSGTDMLSALALAYIWKRKPLEE